MQSHEGGRHASGHPGDRRFWRKVCPTCAGQYDEAGLPRLLAARDGNGDLTLWPVLLGAAS